MRPSLILVAGWAHRAQDLHGLAEALAPAFDVEGTDPAELLQAGDPVLALANRIRQAREPRWLAGWSLGGMMALQAALDAPVAGLVLVSTTPRFCVTPDWPHGLRPGDVRLLRRGLETDSASALRGFYRQCATPLAPLPDPADPGDPSFLLEGLRLLMTWDLRASMLSLDIPTLVLHGEEDRVIPASAGEHLSRALAAAEWRGFQGIGHDLPRRCPAEVAKTITDWIRHGD